MTKIDFCAEVGQNLVGYCYIGKVPASMWLINEIVKSGATYCKWQLYDSQKVFTGNEQWYANSLEAELTKSQADYFVLALKAFNGENNMHCKPLFSAFDGQRISWAVEILSKHFPELPEIDMKIASRVATNKEVLKCCLGFRKAELPSGKGYRPFHGIISHGMKVLTNLEYDTYFPRQTHLFCKSEYPCVYSPEDWHTMEQGFNDGTYQGLSDHSLGIEAIEHAIQLGATVIEKHITIAKNHIGPDHRLSITPLELSQLVSKYNV